MSKSIKITKSDIEKTRKSLNNNINTLEDIEKKIKELSFADEYSSKGKCAKSMADLNKDFCNISNELTTLINATIMFLNDAEKEWFEIDSNIANKY